MSQFYVTILCHIFMSHFFVTLFCHTFLSHFLSHSIVTLFWNTFLEHFSVILFCEMLFVSLCLSLSPKVFFLRRIYGRVRPCSTIIVLFIYTLLYLLFMHKSLCLHQQENFILLYGFIFKSMQFIYLIK